MSHGRTCPPWTTRALPSASSSPRSACRRAKAWEDLHSPTGCAGSVAWQLALEPGAKADAGAADRGARLLPLPSGTSRTTCPTVRCCSSRISRCSISSLRSTSWRSRIRIGGLHPYLLGQMIALFREMSTGKVGASATQIILTTHSAELLDHVRPGGALPHPRNERRGDDGAPGRSREARLGRRVSRVQQLSRRRVALGRSRWRSRRVSLEPSRGSLCRRWRRDARPGEPPACAGVAALRRAPRPCPPATPTCHRAWTGRPGGCRSIRVSPETPRAHCPRQRSSGQAHASKAPYLGRPPAPTSDGRGGRST